MRFSYHPSYRHDWDTFLALARHAEATGFDGVYVADHLMHHDGDRSVGIVECWSMLAGLAVSVPRVRLSPLVSAITFRHPSVLAKIAANVQCMSGGRLILAIGGGWFEEEHTTYGLPFPPVGERLRRLDEACQVLRGLFHNERTTFHGEFYQLDDAAVTPRPAAPPPLMVGGGGEKVTMRIAAKWADEWNIWATARTLAAKGAILDGHCRDIGRDPAIIQRSAITLLALSDDEHVIRETMATARPTIWGNADGVAAMVQKYIDAGCDELIITDHTVDPSIAAKFDAMERFMADVAPRFR